MLFSKFTRKILVALSCAAVLLPSEFLHGENISQSGAQPKQVLCKERRVPLAGDVKLDQDGRLRGAVVNIHGTPVPNAMVFLSTPNKKVTATKTDRLGNFEVKGLSGGAYIISVGHNNIGYRIWTKQTAPPKAKHLALLVVGDSVVRGQHKLCTFLSPDAIAITGMAAAAVTLPLVLRKSSTPQSP